MGVFCPITRKKLRKKLLNWALTGTDEQLCEMLQAVEYQVGGYQVISKKDWEICYGTEF